MLKKTERLSRFVFSLHFAKGKKVHQTYTSIITAKADNFRMAVVVGKKVSKKSPTRNRIKRRIYGLLEEVKKERKLTGVYIVIAKPGLAALTKAAFKQAVLEEFGRVIN